MTFRFEATRVKKRNDRLVLSLKEVNNKRSLCSLFLGRRRVASYTAGRSGRPLRGRNGSASLSTSHESSSWMVIRQCSRAVAVTSTGTAPMSKQRGREAFERPTFILSNRRFFSLLFSISISSQNLFCPLFLSPFFLFLYFTTPSFFSLHLFLSSIWFFLSLFLFFLYVLLSSSQVLIIFNSHSASRYHFVSFPSQHNLVFL